MPGVFSTLARMENACAFRSTFSLGCACSSALLLMALGACQASRMAVRDASTDSNIGRDGAASDGRTPQADALDGSSEAFDEISTIQLTVGDLAFDARAAGPETGELVLLLHGFPQTSYQWRYSLERLARAGYRAVAPDQRGYSPGARPLAVEAYAMRNLVLDVLGIADALGVQRFHVVGHDWGAVVAWVLAALVKDRVLSVTALSTAHPDLIAQQRAMPDSCQSRRTAHLAERKHDDAAAKLLADDARLLRADYADLPRAAVTEYLRVLGTEPALDAALHWFRANIDPPEASAPLGPVAVPALYVFSDQDPTNCRDTADANENFVTGPYRFEVLDGVDHWVAERAPEAFNELLLEHLAAHGAKP